MTRAELLARMDSRELTGWRTLFVVQHDEHEKAAEKARLTAESGDGEVVEHNTPPSRFDDEDIDDDGGPTE